MNESANNNQFNGMNTNNGTYNNQNFSVQDNNTSQNTNVTTNVYSDNGTNIINDPIVIAKQAELDAAGSGLHALVHPCFLYESLWCLIGFVALHFYSKKLKSFDGEIFLLYISWYGLGRFWIEALRTDSLFIGDFKVSQLVAAACVVVGLARAPFRQGSNPCPLVASIRR